MPQIRDLGDIVPEDIEYHIGKERLVLPGDIDVEHTYRLLGLLQSAAEIENAAGQGKQKIGHKSILDAKQENDTAVRDALLSLFQERDPKLEKLPFGVMAMRQVLADVLVAMGFEFTAEAVPPPKAPATSRRSNSSRRSSKSSASRTRKS